jgi:hypothetical protein
MKKLIFMPVMVLSILVCQSCTQKSNDSENTGGIENTLKSVSLLYDSLMVEPKDLLATFERINKAIDTIGYPDAGYKLWLIQGDSIKDFRFMLEGYWPNQAIYDTIHKNKMYLNAATPEMEKLWEKVKNISYHRFTLVK